MNFCKFTNETRNAIEDATRHSGQVWLAAVNGTAAGGGYELALACDEIVLVDDRSTAVSLPEVPLLGVLPGTGGLTRARRQAPCPPRPGRRVRDADRGVRGSRRCDWGLVDGSSAQSLRRRRRGACRGAAAASDRPSAGPGVELTPLDAEVTADGRVRTSTCGSTVTSAPPISCARADEPRRPRSTSCVAAGAGAWPLALCRELDDAVLRLRFNEPEVGTWVLETEGDPAAVLAADGLLRDQADHWFVREIRLTGRGRSSGSRSRRGRSSRSSTPGSCFAGTLAELVLVADRSFMLDGLPEDAQRRGDAVAATPATLQLTEANDGWYPTVNGLTRLGGRFWGRDDDLATAAAQLGKELDAAGALDAGLVTFAPDDIDWDDEVRLAIEERNSFSPDALTGMEANLRFAGPETMESKIFARLSAWQNWIFQRPNAVGPDGALRRFGSGSRPDFDRARV